jgi:hypothetical protein
VASIRRALFVASHADSTEGREEVEKEDVVTEVANGEKTKMFHSEA